MKLLTIVLITTAIIGSILFSVLNTDPVYLNYYYGKSAFPLFLLLAVAFIIGSVLGVLSCLSIVIRMKRENARMKKEIKLSTEEISNLRRLPLRDID